MRTAHLSVPNPRGDLMPDSFGQKKVMSASFRYSPQERVRSSLSQYFQGFPVAVLEHLARIFCADDPDSDRDRVRQTRCLARKIPHQMTFCTPQ